MYYADKVTSLREIFGAADVVVAEDHVRVDGRCFPMVDDVIICLPLSAWPTSLRARLGMSRAASIPNDLAEDIQFSFGEEWKGFPSLLPDHEDVFRQYFDLIDLDDIAGARICDMGCGMGRWSHFVGERCREIVLVDFSESIFVARDNLRNRSNAIYVMADVRHLPFAYDFADLVVCLGVLHHLPTPALEEVVVLGKYAPRLLVYLYYALDNRPLHFRILLAGITPMRLLLSRVRSRRLRSVLTNVIAYTVYGPLVRLGGLLRPCGFASRVPLYDTYHGRTLTAIKQDVYDRFFTRIEQRVTRKQIEALDRHFRTIIVSDDPPYWHFLCLR